MSDSQKWFSLAMVVLIGALIWLLAPILTPFAAAALLAYLGDPFVDWLEARRLGRTLAVVIVFLVLSLALATFLLILIPLLEDQVVRLVRRLPQMIEWAQGHLRALATETLGPDYDLFDTQRIIEMVRSHGQQVGGAAAFILGSITRSGAALVALLINLLLIPVVTFYLLRDWDLLVARVRGLLPRNVEPTVVRLTRESDTVLGAFLRGQILVMLLLGIAYALGLWLVGIDLALLIGMLAGLISFVPYLGTIVGVALGVLAALFQYHDFLHVALVLVVFGVGQLLEGMVLTPLLVGDRIGLHPVAVIFAVLAGGQLFGFFGILIALPVAAVIMVLLRHAHQRYVGSRLYGAPTDGQPVPPPAET